LADQGGQPDALQLRSASELAARSPALLSVTAYDSQILSPEAVEKMRKSKNEKLPSSDSRSAGNADLAS
jgi:hypothetical protein